MARRALSAVLRRSRAILAGKRAEETFQADWLTSCSLYYYADADERRAPVTLRTDDGDASENTVPTLLGRTQQNISGVGGLMKKKKITIRIFSRRIQYKFKITDPIIFGGRLNPQNPVCVCHCYVEIVNAGARRKKQTPAKSHYTFAL